MPSIAAYATTSSANGASLAVQRVAQASLLLTAGSVSTALKRRSRSAASPKRARMRSVYVRACSPL
jgi:hypothetical protein